MPARGGLGRALRLGRHAPLRISIDGDSLTDPATVYSWFKVWMADTAISYPGVATRNFAVAGADIAPTENATNNLMGRVSNVAGWRPSLHVIASGTNDLQFLDANTFISQRLIPYVHMLRAAIPGVKIVAAGIPPCSATASGTHTVVNGRRGSVNAQLRALVGTELDGYIPRGEHPVYDVDSAPDNTTWWSGDGIHPLQVPHSVYKRMLHDVLDPYIVQALGYATVPTLSFPNLSDILPSTTYAMRARVTGLPFGKSLILGVSGSGAQIANGLGAFGTTSLAVMNGDLPQVQNTASASNTTEVDSTYTFNGVSSTWKLTTRPASWPATTTTLDPTHKASTATLSNGNLTVVAGSGNSNLLAMATAQPATDLIYFEVTLGVAGDLISGKKVAIHDASLIGHYNDTFAGSSAGYITAGLTLQASGPIFINGAAVTTVDSINFPALASGSVLGVCFQKSTGKVWFQTASGVFWPTGDPTALEGGLQLSAPLAQTYCSAIVQTNAQGETFNYGGTGAPAFAYPVPLGFRPHC